MVLFPRVQLLLIFLQINCPLLDMNSSNCIFCKIIEGNCPETVIEYEDNKLIIFKDIKPASDHHYLAVPKTHIDNIKCLKANDTEMLESLENAMKNLMVSKGLNINDAQFGFHWPPFITVGHLHLHGIAPVSKMKLLARTIFKPGTMWFSTNEYAKKWIMNNKK